MVTHDLDTLTGLASHVAVLAEQRIVEFGPLAVVMAGDNPLVAAFRGANGNRLMQES